MDTKSTELTTKSNIVSSSPIIHVQFENSIASTCKKDLFYSKWYVENQKVKSWLLTSMTPKIMKRYLRLHTAREISSTLAKTFHDGSDETQIFAFNHYAFSLRQSGHSVPIYYGELIEIFQELDYHDKVNMRDPDDIIMYKTSIEKLRIHIFLNGLDTKFEQV
ncbi:hypothetical protein SADUNF_Sadunf01G0121800 [Salix dunnii]|uniref:Retrotransposon gag domain-containing protein n=1 Tax=Salix dunnii TaxID=1413687 RepID=A0A835NBA8_9ROSI|nr:hypothetical protein SADUNF_Sadunf01G0121800 [Salix dunnii]